LCKASRISPSSPSVAARAKRDPRLPACTRPLLSSWFIPWLRGLGIRIDDARRAAELCADIPDAPLEARVRRALSYFGKRAGVRVVAAV